MGRTCGTFEGKEKCIRSCGGETESKIQIGKSRIRWDDKIKTHLKQTVCSHGWTLMNTVVIHLVR